MNDVSEGEVYHERMMFEELDEYLCEEVAERKAAVKVEEDDAMSDWRPEGWKKQRRRWQDSKGSMGLLGLWWHRPRYLEQTRLAA